MKFFDERVSEYDCEFRFSIYLLSVPVSCVSLCSVPVPTCERASECGQRRDVGRVAAWHCIGT